MRSRPDGAEMRLEVLTVGMGRATATFLAESRVRVRSRLAVFLMAVGLAAVPFAVMAVPAMAAAAGTTTCTQSSSGATTCTETGSTGAVVGTCTVTGASYCTPVAAGASTAAGSGAINGNLSTIKSELTPNIGAIFTNPVTAPLMKLGLFILDCIAIGLLGSALVRLMIRVHEQAKGETLDHKSLHGTLFAVGVLLLIVAGGGIWLLTGAVAGIQSLMHG